MSIFIKNTSLLHLYFISDPHIIIYNM
jgi:hypothetical protein